MSKTTCNTLRRRAADLEQREPDFAAFLALLVASVDPEDLLPYDAGALEALWRKAFAGLDTAGLDRPHVTISPPQKLGALPVQVIDVVSPDMPFIVDSVLAAIRAAGGQVRFIAHPVLKRGGQAVSFLEVHVEPLADADALTGEIVATLDDVESATADWKAMSRRLHECAGALPPGHNEETAFLDWLDADNFTFLGSRDYRLDASGELAPQPGSGLGILRDDAVKFLRQGADYVEVTPEHRAFMAANKPLLVTKANIRARVHRRAHMDYIGVKRYGADGGTVGETRFVGLFTSQALATPHAGVPLIRDKRAAVIAHSGLDPHGHAGKALLSALDLYPRDELFQIEPAQLAEFAADIAALADRPRIRVFPRIDAFDNFVSILLYMPREAYDSGIRARIGAYLAEAYDGRLSAFYPNFLEGDLVRVHFIIGRVAGKTPEPKREKLEADIAEMAKSYGDRLLEQAGTAQDIARWRAAFPLDYQASYAPEMALADIAVFEGLADEAHIAVALGTTVAADQSIALKLYHGHSPIPLSDRVPILENFGFRVIDERTYRIATTDGAHYLHDMVLVAAEGITLDLKAQKPLVEAALLAVWDGEAENDGFNALVLKAELEWTDVALLRALARYLRQIGAGWSQTYLARVLCGQPQAAGRLLDLFHALHDPAIDGQRDSLARAAREAIAAALDATTSLDEERIIKAVLNLVEASLRTNAFAERRPQALAIKFDCARIEGLPEPHPFREIFVYSPRFEGLHLRFGAIARGGIRWSDRPEDFRTEILGLVKAQQVKNAVIVPVGAKGGFVPKRMPANPSRETFMAEGTACYKIFINALLELTDNIVDDAVVPPADMIRRDGDDPYLVVAADKGTASFSDTANAIALDRHYWLGDAFASGGSTGYDHKKIGITARGAWESVKRHFREMDRNVETEPFTLVGVGDMSGDVFGNGLLLSKTARLIAAFDHRDIFVDPDPDPETSFAERRRLFGLPRSSWQDYDEKLLSKGGFIVSRSAKAVPLSTEARRALGLAGQTVTPAELMSAILRAEVDLVWFGGIGTYVRSASESDAEAGDRANDAIRITGGQIRAKVVGEGANLAMTQKGRIEYALNGGRLNTDAIDNSAGVNSSDLEVNIKIALGSLTRAKTLTYEARNAFLAEMTDEVAALCLRNNYLQTLALSLTERRGMAEFPDLRDLIVSLEAKGELHRAVEFLPDEATLAARATAGQPFTRPELAVLLAYGKLDLYAALLETDVPDDAYLSRELFRYFPETLNTRYPEAVETHRLRREVIATVLANAMINRGGPAFVSKLVDATSADAGAIAAAYAATRDAYGLTDLNAAIDTLDGRVPGDVQLTLYAEVEALLRRQTLWFLRNESFAGGLSPLIERYGAGVARVREMLPGLLPAPMAAAIAETAGRFADGGVDSEVANRIALLPALSFASDIVLIAARANTDTGASAEAFFGVLKLFDLGTLIFRARDLVLADRFDRLALDRAIANLWRALRDLTADVLAEAGTGSTERLAAYRQLHEAAVARTAASVADLTAGELTVSRLSVAAGLLADLARAA